VRAGVAVVAREVAEERGVTVVRRSRAASLRTHRTLATMCSTRSRRSARTANAAEPGPVRRPAGSMSGFRRKRLVGS